jgi:hypothetical protein
MHNLAGLIEERAAEADVAGRADEAAECKLEAAHL